MSSFDQFTVLAIQDENGRERFLWQQDDQPIRDETPEGPTLTDLACEVVAWFDSEVAAGEA
ncbi:MAG: hypothetical protein MI919_20040 [Holophagales bacterium]|nr:hypothetical protein [Holophagales bacterium]